MKKRPTPHEKSSALEQRRDSITDLFPESVPRRPAPTVPTKRTVKHAALLALIFGPVSQATFERSWRLAAYINELTADGWAIRSREIAWQGKTIAEYNLDFDHAPTRAAVAAVRAGGQAGFVRPDLVGLVAVAVPAVVALLAAFFGGA